MEKIYKFVVEYDNGTMTYYVKAASERVAKLLLNTKLSKLKGAIKSVTVLSIS